MGMDSKDDFFGLLGSLIDNTYRVTRVVGEGGFGVVYQAEDESLGVTVALKCLKVPSHYVPEVQQRFLEKFRDEARLLARLGEHPGIVRVYRFGVVATGLGSVPYLALEWLKGEDLEHFIDRRRRQNQPFTESEAVTMISPVVEAIAFAHRRGVAHRDLKPANIFVTEVDGQLRLKVLDFGIAKVMQEGEAAAQQVTKTSSGFSAYSPQYGAPEQVHSKQYGASGPWTDVHALGLICCDLLTNRSGLGDDPMECALACLNPNRPTPRALGAVVSDRFEAIIARCLALSAKERFPHAGALLAELTGRAATEAEAPLGESRWQGSETSFGSTTPSNLGHRRRTLGIVGGVVVGGLLLALGVWWVASRSTASPVAGSSSVVTPPAQAPTAPVSASSSVAAAVAEGTIEVSSSVAPLCKIDGASVSLPAKLVRSPGTYHLACEFEGQKLERLIEVRTGAVSLIAVEFSASSAKPPVAPPKPAAEAKPPVSKPPPQAPRNVKPCDHIMNECP